MRKKAANAICEAFHGPAPSRHIGISYKDGDSTNLRPDNMQWAWYADLHQEGSPLTRRSCGVHECDEPLTQARAQRWLCPKHDREFMRAWKTGTQKAWLEKNVRSDRAVSRRNSFGYPPRSKPVIRRYLAGKLGYLEAAGELDIHYSTFYRWVDKFCEETGRKRPEKRIRTPRKKYLDREKKLEAAKYAVKFGAKEAAEKYGVSDRTIIRWKKKFGLAYETELGLSAWDYL